MARNYDGFFRSTPDFKIDHSVDFSNQSRTRQTKSVSRYVDPTKESDVPEAQAGIPVPYLIGRRRITRPNTIWTGVPKTEKTTFKSQRDPFQVGLSTTHNTQQGPQKRVYVMSNADPSENEELTELKSYVAFAVAFCLGPDVRLFELYDNQDTRLWAASSLEFAAESGDVVTPTSQENYKNLTFYGGNFDQPVNNLIKSQEGADKTPAFRGTSYVLVNEALIDTDNKIYGLRAECYRVPDPLTLGDDNKNATYDVNIATAIYDILTNPWGGVGIDPGYIDLPSFAGPGAVLASEGNFCSVLISNKTNVKSVLAGLCDQAYGALRWNAGLKKIQFILFREDWNIDTIPLFNEDNLADIVGVSKDTWYFLPQSFELKFLDRKDRYKQTPALVGINRTSAEHAKRGESDTMDTICEADNAIKVAAREFGRRATPILSAELQANRDANSVLPGEVVKATWARNNLSNFPFRVTNVKEAGSLLNTIILTVEQASLPFTKTTYGVPENLANENGEVVTSPETGNAYAVPFFIANRRDISLFPPLNDFDDNFVFWNIIATGGSGSFTANYADAGTGLTYELVNSGNTSTTATLVAAMGELDGYTTNEIASVVVTPGSEWSRFDFIPDSATFANVFSIDGEWFTYNTATDNGDGTVTLNDVQRGLIDSVPSAHAMGAVVVFFPSFYNLTRIGLDVAGGPVTLSLQGDNGFTIDFTTLDITAPATARGNRPAAPFNAMIAAGTGANMYPRPASGQTAARSSSYYVSWRQRNRRNTTSIVPPNGASEATTGTTYNIDLVVGAYSASLATGVSGTEANVTIPAGATTGAGKIEITAVDAQGNSVFKAFVSVNVT